MALAALVVNLKGNRQHLQQTLQRSRGDVGGFVARVRQSLGSLGRAIGLAGGLVGLGSLAGGITFGIKLAAEAEQAETAFATLLGSATSAKRVLADLSNFAASTPFQLTDLRSGAQKLLAFGVAQSDLMDRMQLLGDIAAGTGKPIGEFAAIFGKVKATGRTSLEQVNQLAERGVPIYRALANTMGVTEGEIRSLASTGKIGFTEMLAAMQSTTAAGGVFHGGMVAQSRTISGLFSTLKDNVSFVLQDVGAALIQGFDFSGLLNQGISFAQGIRGSLGEIVPIVQGLAGVTKSTFRAMWDAIAAPLLDLTGLAGNSSVQITEKLVTALAYVEGGVASLVPGIKLATNLLLLMPVQAAGVLRHFVGTVIPAYATHFVTHWQTMLFDSHKLTAVTIKNIAANVRSVLSSLWEWIASGGTAAFAVTWIPLETGFTRTLTKLPEIAARELGALEQTLTEDSRRLGAAIADNMTDTVTKRLADLQAFRAKQAADIAALDGPAPPTSLPATPATNASVAAGSVSAMRTAAQQLIDSARTPLQQFRAEVAELRQLATAGLIDRDTLSTAVDGAYSKLKQADVGKDIVGRFASQLDRLRDLKRSGRLSADAVDSEAGKGLSRAVEQLAELRRNGIIDQNQLDATIAKLKQTKIGTLKSQSDLRIERLSQGKSEGFAQALRNRQRFADEFQKLDARRRTGELDRSEFTRAVRSARLDILSRKPPANAAPTDAAIIAKALARSPDLARKPTAPRDDRPNTERATEGDVRTIAKNSERQLDATETLIDTVSRLNLPITREFGAR